MPLVHAISFVYMQNIVGPYQSTQKQADLDHAIFVRGYSIFENVKMLCPPCTYWVKCDRAFLAHLKVSKGAMIRNRYNQVPHLT